MVMFAWAERWGGLSSPPSSCGGNAYAGRVYEDIPALNFLKCRVKPEKRSR
jgi:hypothetical protein